MSLTDAAEAALAGHLFGTTTWTKPANRYLALMTTATTDAGGGSEVSTTSTGYARQVIAYTITGTTPTTVTNTSQIDFPAATSSWGTITNVALFDAATGGTMWQHATLASSVAIATTQVFRIAAGALTITID